MKKKERVKLKREFKDFSNEFLKLMKENIDLVVEFNSCERNAFPNIFNKKNLEIECLYSIDRKHVAFIFKSSIKNQFTMKTVEGDVLNELDESQTWSKWPVAIKVESSKINLKNVNVQGMKPFEFEGDNIEIQIENLKLGLPYGRSLLIEYALVFSEDKLKKIMADKKKFVKDIFLGYSKFYQEYGVKITEDEKNREKYLKNLLNVKKEMEYYFFNEDVKELEIDKFIFENPLILELTLGLEKLKSQVILSDQSGRFSQDLKPDLIAYDFSKKRWAIVDYKRSKSELLKNNNNIRSAFRAEITDLNAQLRDYKEYFEDSVNRKYYENKYGDYLEYPYAIGIIGKLKQEYTRDFNRIRDDLPNWVEIIPYNHIYDDFSRYIERLPF